MPRGTKKHGSENRDEETDSLKGNATPRFLKLKVSEGLKLRNLSGKERMG